MPRMRSLVKHEYDNRSLEAEQEFEADPAHVQLLIAMGRAEVLDVAQRNTRAMESTHSTRVMNTRRGGRPS